MEYRNKRTQTKKIKRGVPQGRVISPTLFNLYMNKNPHLHPTSRWSHTYWSSSTNINELCHDNKHLFKGFKWLVHGKKTHSHTKNQLQKCLLRGLRLHINMYQQKMSTYIWYQLPKNVGPTLWPTIIVQNPRWPKPEAETMFLAGSSLDKVKETIITPYKITCLNA